MIESPQRDRSRRFVAAVLLPVMAVAVVGCGSDGEANGTPQTASQESGAEGTEESSGGAETTPLGQCPAADAVSGAYGGEAELDEQAATTGAVGLVFCPYVEVIGPGVTDAFGAAPIPDSFSLTLTDQDVAVADPALEAVSGLGERAFWSSSGELTVWTGDRGIIVSMPFDPPGGDKRAASIAIAELAL